MALPFDGATRIDACQSWRGKQASKLQAAAAGAHVCKAHDVSAATSTFERQKSIEIESKLAASRTSRGDTATKRCQGQPCMHTACWLTPDSLLSGTGLGGPRSRPRPAWLDALTDVSVLERNKEGSDGIFSTALTLRVLVAPCGQSSRWRELLQASTVPSGQSRSFPGLQVYSSIPKL